jgi:hypothetical protein
VASQQLTMFMTDYEKLAEQRDFAAYRAVGAISAAICYCKNGQLSDVLHILTSALEDYESVANKLEHFKTHKGENHAVHASN